MASSLERPTFEDPALQRQIMQLRQVDNIRILVFLAFEYLSLAIVIGCAVVFAEYREAWGLLWFWNIPVFTIAIVLIGGIQHRLAGLGHESSHYSFMRNRYLNDLIPDLFCMFPLLTTIHFYRVFHMGHHQFTNDPARDPDLQNLGHAQARRRVPDGPRPVHHRDLFLLSLSRRSAFSAINGPISGSIRWARGKMCIWIARLLEADAPSLDAAAGDGSGDVAIFSVLSLVFKFLTGMDSPAVAGPAGLVGIMVLAVVIRVLPNWAAFNRRSGKPTRPGSRDSCE